MKRVSIWLAGLAGLLPLIAGQGCPNAMSTTPGATTGTNSNSSTSTTGTNSDTSTNTSTSNNTTPDTSTNTTTAADLSTNEKAAIDGVAESAAALTQAATTSHHGASSTGGSNAQTIPTGTITIGTCPAVSATLTNLSGLALAVTVDFGTGCHLFGLQEYTCSGSATGTVNQAASTFNIQFNHITCNDDTLTGNAALTFHHTTTGTDLDGDWDLGFGSDDYSITANGHGMCSFNSSTKVTTIPSFSGQITNTNGMYTGQLTDIQVSYANSTNLVPFAGTMTVSSPTIRTCTVRFNANSPTTGDVEVSVDGSPFFNANLFSM